MQQQSLSNLLSGKAPLQRGLENQHRILQFLQQEKFSTRQILQSLLGIKTRGGLWKILSKMEKKNWVKQYSFSSSFTLWGITIDGIKECAFTEGATHDFTAFQPSKISSSTIQHSLDIQAVHVACEQLGIEFQPGRELGSRAEVDKIPDGLVHINGKLLAIEVERTLKSSGRYDAIIYNYLKAIKQQDYVRVVYVMPDAKKLQQVKRSIFNLGHITMHVHGEKQRIKLNPETHLSYFDFVSLNKLPDYLQVKMAQLSAN